MTCERPPLCAASEASRRFLDGFASKVRRKRPPALAATPPLALSPSRGGQSLAKPFGLSESILPLVRGRAAEGGRGSLTPDF